MAEQLEAGSEGEVESCRSVNKTQNVRSCFFLLFPELLLTLAALAARSVRVRARARPTSLPPHSRHLEPIAYHCTLNLWLLYLSLTFTFGVSLSILQGLLSHFCALASSCARLTSLSCASLDLSR